MKFGVIGFGNMGGAIVKGAVASGVLAKEDVLVYDIKESARKAAEEFGLKVAKDDEDVTANSDVTLLAVKPQQMSEAMATPMPLLADTRMLGNVVGSRRGSFMAPS